MMNATLSSLMPLAPGLLLFERWVAQMSEQDLSMTCDRKSSVSA